MILFNSVSPETYNAHLLDYTIGSVGPTNSYFSSKYDLFFVKFSTRASLRTITAKFEFVGEDETEAVESISGFTASLMGSADLEFPDGFLYHCMLTKLGNPKRVTDNIYTADFTFLGYRHKAQVVVPISSTKTINVQGNYETSCALSFTPTQSGAYVKISNSKFTETFKVNLSEQSAVVIDGVTKKATRADGTNIFGSCVFTNFPRLIPGNNKITISKVTDVSVTYLPIFV